MKYMKRISILCLQAAVILVGVGALVFLLGEPHLEGRNVGATAFEIYFKDPFLAYAYLSSIPFFVALFQAFRVLGLVGRGEALSHRVSHGLRIIRRCSTLVAALAAGGLASLLVTVPAEEDRAGGLALGLLVISVSVASAIAAGLLERKCREGIQSV